jgi:hypothetical protein
MLRRFAWVVLLPLVAASMQQPPVPPPGSPRSDAESHETDVRLPNGKLQRDEIAKFEYEKSLQDAAALAKLSEDLKSDLEKGSAFVVSIQTIKKTEEIEKLAKRIRGRLKHN